MIFFERSRSFGFIHFAVVRHPSKAKLLEGYFTPMIEYICMMQRLKHKTSIL